MTTFSPSIDFTLSNFPSKYDLPLVSTIFHFPSCFTTNFPSPYIGFISSYFVSNATDLSQFITPYFSFPTIKPSSYLFPNGLMLLYSFGITMLPISSTNPNFPSFSVIKLFFIPFTVVIELYSHFNSSFPL